MALHAGMLTQGFTMPSCEKHFHDHDETWLILAGRGTAYVIDHDGRREDIALQAGDVLMIPAGCEHGSDGPNTFAMNAVIGTLAPGAHPPGHYYVEESGYLPSLSLVRTPSERYPTGSPYRSDPPADRSGLGGLLVAVLGDTTTAAYLGLVAALTPCGALVQVGAAESGASGNGALVILPGATASRALLRDFFAAGKPVAALAAGVGVLLQGDVLGGRTVSAPRELRPDLASAGAVTGDLGVCTDTGLVTAAAERDAEAWTAKVLEVFAEGVHPMQRRSVESNSGGRSPV